MNTKVTLSDSHKSTDNLLILADKKNIKEFKTLLSEKEYQFLEYAIQKDISHVFFPRMQRLILVQFLKENKNTALAKEETRVAGSDILSRIEHYKIEEITLINWSTHPHVLEYLEGMLLSNYQFLKYFSHKKDKQNYLKAIHLDAKFVAPNEIDHLLAVVEATFVARDLVNEPQSYLTATQLSEDILTLGKKCGFGVEVFDKAKIEALKMGGILAVNMGSFTPPRFNILEWKPENATNAAPIVLVGKGIVYDTGGLSLKPTANSMDRMKADMGGAATVVGIMAAVATAKLPIHVIALIPSTDNRPGNNAYAPGDVIKMYSGTTVEVLNTDAEGRLVLADALHYAKQYNPELVLDFATLTGAAARAIGSDGISYMGTADQAVKSKMEQSGHEVYERLVEFPLWKEYGEQIKSNIADLKNVGSGSGGMITAGKFLQHFTDYPWLHFDIAGIAYITKANTYRTKEGTGVGVRLVFNFLKNYSS